MQTTIFTSDTNGLVSVGNANPLPVKTRGYSCSYISSATTTQVKTGAGFLHSITVNLAAAGTITLIDGVSGTTANIGLMKASIGEGTYTFDVEFSTGLKVMNKSRYISE